MKKRIIHIVYAIFLAGALISTIPPITAFSLDYTVPSEAIEEQAEINDIIADLTTRVQNLEADLAAVEDNISENSNMILANVTEIAHISASLDELLPVVTNAATKADIKAAMDIATQAIDEAVDALKTRVENLEADLAAAEDNISENVHDIAVNAAEIARISASLDELLPMVSNAATKEELESAIKTATETIAAAVANLTNRVQNLESDVELIKDIGIIEENMEALAKINATLAELSARITDSATKTELDDAINSIAATIGVLDNTIKVLQQEINDIEDELNNAITELDAAMKNGDTDLSAEIASLNAVLANAKAVLEVTDSTNKAELITKIDEADAVLQAAIDALSTELNNVKQRTEELENKNSVFQTFIIIACIISAVAFCGCSTLAVCYIIDKKKY